MAAKLQRRVSWKRHGLLFQPIEVSNSLSQPGPRQLGRQASESCPRGSCYNRCASAQESCPIMQTGLLEA